MVFNIKNLLKKVCLLGASATMAFGLCSSFVSAAAPTASDPGVSLDNTATIGKATGITGNTNGTQASNTITVDANLASSLVFNGTAQKIIIGIDHVYFGTGDVALNITGDDSDVNLYLRVADSQGANPTTAADWVKYEGADSLLDAALTRRALGTYYVYYFIDGKGNINDVGTGTGT